MALAPESPPSSGRVDQVGGEFIELVNRHYKSAIGLGPSPRWFIFEGVQFIATLLEHDLTTTVFPAGPAHAC